MGEVYLAPMEGEEAGVSAMSVFFEYIKAYLNPYTRYKVSDSLKPGAR